MKVASPLPHKKARIEIIPLIDIMFFLLASFMMVSLSQVHMKGIRVNLPSSIAVPQATPPQQKDFTSLFVDADGLVHFDKEVVPDDDVMAKLLQLFKSNKDAKVFISADKEALHGDVIKLLDRVRSAGIEKVGYEIKVKAGASAGAPGAPGVPPPAAPPPPPSP